MKILEVNIVKGVGEADLQNSVLIDVTFQDTLFIFFKTRYTRRILVTLYQYLREASHAVDIDTGESIDYNVQRAISGHLKLKGIL